MPKQQCITSLLIRTAWLLAAMVIAPTTSNAFPADFDGDGVADLALWRNTDATWYVIPSGNATPSCFSLFGVGAALQFGLPGDKPFIGDFDGDGIADPSVFRPNNLTLYIKPSSWCPTASLVTVSLAGTGIAATDIPDAGEVTNDAYEDLLMYRPPSGSVSPTWYVRSSQLGTVSSFPAGAGLSSVIDGAVTVTGNYRTNSGGLFLGAEPTAFNRGRSFISGFGTTNAVSWSWISMEHGTPAFGTADLHLNWHYGSTVVLHSDVPVNGNYGGPTNLHNDFVRWRGTLSPSTKWNIDLNPGATTSVDWGLIGDIPVGGDYDGAPTLLDDPMVFRPSEGRWYLKSSSCPNHMIPVGSGTCIRDWGISGDRPMGN